MKKSFATYSFVILAFLLFSCESKSAQKSRLKTENTTTLLSNENSSKASNQNSLKIITWNIQELGQSKNQEEILNIAKIIKPYDIVAIQEVVAKDPRGAQAVAKIADELNRMGNKWDYSISNPTKSPSSNMSERYAYIWKTSKIKLVSKPYLDSELEEKCIREPYIAEFKLKKENKSFFLINFHSRVHSQNPEKEIVFFKNYPKRLNSERIFILGDFNLNEKHSVWNELYNNGFKSAIQNSPTTLKKKCKRKKYLNHSIDNIYFNTKNIDFLNSGKVDFVGSCRNLINARKISDHLPVFIECNIN